MSDLTTSLIKAFDYVSTVTDIPNDIWVGAAYAGVFKAAGELSAINSMYHDAITQNLVKYFEGGSVAGPKNSYKRSMVEAFGSALDLGWSDGGGTPPPDADTLEWFNTRVGQELAYIDTMYQEAKELRKEEGFDYFSWVTARADGYTNTLREIYNVGKLRAMSNKMVTFLGEDGAESCDTCQKLKGKRHKISWFVANNYVPPFGTGLDCHQGRRCQHYLQDDEGNAITV
jgi:hypothetical protein